MEQFKWMFLLSQVPRAGHFDKLRAGFGALSSRGELSPLRPGVPAGKSIFPGGSGEVLLLDIPFYKNPPSA
jgi:hypothetical protein